MKKITIIAFLVISLSTFAQDKKVDLKEVAKLYSTELKLDKTQSEKLKSIFNTYENKLYKKSLEANVFNATLKLQTLEVHKLLSKEQFESYLKLRSKHQPELSYKFQ